jgi:hypothetical protein
MSFSRPPNSSAVRFCVAGFVLAGCAASARSPSVTVESIEPYEAAAGYVYAELMMHGNVERADGTEGTYSVPIILKYPVDGGNGVGVVDWVNSSQLQNEGWIADEFRINQILLTTVGDFLFEEGYTYAAVQWGKSVTEIFGPTPPADGRPYNHLAYGTIERGEDAYAILRDVARVLRQPGRLAAEPDPTPVDVVISSGYSQTGALQMAFLGRRENLKDGAPAYDGHLIGKVGWICPQLDDVAPDFGMIPQPCTRSPNGDGSKVIHVAAQGDLEQLFMAARTRFEGEPDWRQYELAGVAHVPPSIINLGGVQNPIESGPVFRGALRNLTLWIRDAVPAPPSRFLQGTIDDEGNLRTVLDEDGNAVGGLRLPHMESTIEGVPAGAPLGTYTGLNPEGGPPYGLFGGTFRPLSEEELRKRYPDPNEYQARVARAADWLLEAGYIVERDRDAYLREAEGGPPSP